MDTNIPSRGGTGPDTPMTDRDSATFNSDLLPPIFDQIVALYTNEAAAPFLRADIVKTVESGIVTAAAEHVRRRMQEPGQKPPQEEKFELHTSDRLSGDHISRAALSDQIRLNLSVDTNVAEIALLLIEAQIDLRLKTGNSFNFGGIEFDRESDEGFEVASWCQEILTTALDAAARDKPTLWKRMVRRMPDGLRSLAESLQLSATLRDATPYRIRVARYLVSPLLTDRRSEERIRVLHISDLHLVEDLTNPERGGSPTLGQKGHNFDTAKLLGRTVDGLRPSFDLLVATGDLSTDGSRGALETVLQFVQSGPISGENKMRIAAFGLNAGKDRRILLPGNHDRFDARPLPGQRASNLFEEVLNIDGPYPYLVGYRPPGSSENSLTLMLFVFDSNLPEGPDTPSAAARFNAIARGKIRREEVLKMIDLAKDAVRNRRIHDANGLSMNFDPDNCIRIALLHHHPVKQTETSPSRGKVSKWLREPVTSIKDAYAAAYESAMQLDGADYFLSGCFSAGIQIVLFGHRHNPFRRPIVPQDGPQVSNSPFGEAKIIRSFCCPTTLERSEHGNGFYVFDFYDRNQFSLDVYISSSDGKKSKQIALPFTRDSALSGSFHLDSLSDKESASAYEVPRGATYLEAETS